MQQYNNKQINRLQMYEESEQHSEEEMKLVNEYGQSEYWEKRYKENEGQRFDWLQNYSALHNLINQELHNNKDGQILNLGCGNGRIQEELYEDGYQNIINNDISPAVIAQMEKVKQEKGYNKMEYHVMDVTEMDYPSKTYDMVLDKSTIDALLCSKHPYVNTARMLLEVERVLKDDGVYVIISYGSPETRMEHLRREHVGWEIRIENLIKKAEDGGELLHYVYVCRKCPHQQKTKEELQTFFQELQQLEKQECF